MLLEKFREAAASVLPIVLLVALLCLVWVPMQNDLMLAFVLGSLFLVVGMGLFSLGAELSMSQIGSHIGAKLTKSRKPWLILSVSFVLGVVITVAEPDLQVLAGNVPAINTTVLIVVVSVGVGLFLLLSMFRILHAIELRWLILGFYGLVFLLAVFADPDFLAVAFDSGGVTTGPMTVPFIMALGVGVASIRSDERAQQDSFGLVGLCSIGPILAVLILGFIYRSAPETAASTVIASYVDTVALGRGYLAALPESLHEVFNALLPIVAFFLIFQVISLRLRRAPFLRIVVGLLMTLAGLVLFLTGVNVGFSSLGYMLGQRLAEPQWRFLLVPLSMVMGWFIINAEPAVQVLNKQVEELSAGAISARAMGLSLSIAVSAAMGLSMVRALTGISILWFVVPGYAIALGLSFVVPGTFTAIAFDSGGVASGPLTAAFMLPFAMGAVTSMGGNIMTDAFGLVALVAMMPLITVQIMGLIAAITARVKAPKPVALPFADSDIIELWEV
ncbi:MAG: DUF1538 domain-containing protein [Clostridia bacterium]|nr:DUF1538 domain-containing protein [Clostridia bacterium]